MFRTIWKFVVGVNPVNWLIGIAIVIAIFFAAPYATTVMHWFGWQSKGELKEELGKVKKEKEEIAKVNDNQGKVIDSLDQTNKNTQESIGKKVENDKKTDRAVDTIIKKKDDKVDEIWKSSDITAEIKRQKVSEVQINSLWDTFCKFNPEKDDCTSVKE
jgi:Sec-independent protein translocase protein TatA